MADRLTRLASLDRRTRTLRKIGHFLQYIPFRIAFGLMRLVPVRVASAGMGGLLRFIGPKLPYSRRIDTNLDLAMPEATAAEHRRIRRGVWDNLGRVAGELAHVDALWEPKLLDVAAEYGFDEILAAAGRGEEVVLKSDRIEVVGAQNFALWDAWEGPALMYTPHMGNWELLPMLSARFGVLTSVVFRRPNNPFIARHVERMRAGMVSLIPKGYLGAIQAGRVMEAGGRLGFLIDQKQNRGIEAPFFGKPAMTGYTLAKLALDFDAPIFGAVALRIGPAKAGGSRFRIIVTPPLDYTATDDRKADQLAITTLVNEQVEAWVREWPEQWLWLHRRWPKELYK